MIALAVRYWQAALIVALLGFGVIQWKRHSAALVREGQAIERVRVADSTLAVLAIQQRKVDSVYVRDTLRFTRWRDSVAVQHDTVLAHLTDTLIVKEFVRVADSTLASCSDLFRSCQVRASVLEAQLTQERSKLAVAPLTSPRSCTGANAVWGLLGAGAGFLGARIVR